MRRVRETELGSTDASLLDAPLPPESGEGDSAPAPERTIAEKEPAKASPAAIEIFADEPRLADIARAVVAEDAATKARNVAKEMLAAAEANRPSVPAEPAFRAAAPRHVEPKAVQAVHEATARSELPARDRKEEPRRGFGVIALGAAGALALAAGAALYVTVRTAPERGAVAEASAESPAPGSATEAKPAAVAKADEAPPRPQDVHEAVTLEDLAPAAAAPAQGASQKGSAASAAAAAPPTTTLDGLSGKEALAYRMKKADSAGNAKGKLVLEETPEGDEQQVVQAAPPPQANAVSAAEPGGLPPHPSLGAVQAAVGSVMMGARSCLAGQESGSKATVVFGSDGKVRSVTLSGPAAGSPAESCVRSALSGARVPPFTDVTYSASLTVRPL
jgi:hypothetical protein